MRTLRLLLTAPLLALLIAGSPPATAAVSSSGASADHCRRTLPDYPVLRPGARRPAVRTLQCALDDLGYGPLAVDGYYGPQTRRAVRRVESTFEGDPPHPGRIGNGFWTLLYGRQLPSRVLRLGDHGHAVRVLQRALRAAGGDLAVDGRFGPQTRSVVRAYQREFQYRPTGRYNREVAFMLSQGGVFGPLT